MRTTRKSIFTSAISLLLCFAMLLGTTFAWFTDSASSTGNVIQTGRLDAEMYWSDELLDVDSDEWQDASDTAVFTYNNWEPGYTELKYIKVANAGSLNFKWKITVEANGPVSALSDVIDVYYVNPITSEINGLQGLSDVGTLTDVMLRKTSSSGSLTPDSSVILAIAFHMDENAGNEYKGMSLCDSGFSLKLMATQDIGEFDSFGNSYDADAEWEDGVVNFSAVAAVSELPMIYGALASTVMLGTSDGVGAVLPAGVEIADDATELTLSVRDANGESNVTAGEGESAKSLDVHIEGIAASNTVPMIVNLGAILQPGLGDTELKLYHDENGAPVPMTRVGSVDDFAVHNQYTYNFETGEVSIFVASFSIFSAVKTSADEWDGTYDMRWYSEAVNEFTLTTAEELAGFRVIVDGGYYTSAWTWVSTAQDSFAGKTVTLDADIDLMNKPFDPIGFGYTYGDKYNGQAFMGTFDGANHTIYNLYQNCWELDPDKTSYSTYTYSTAGAGLFASVENATVKNLTMSGAEVVFECVDMGVLVGYAQGDCCFENIVITNANIANYNRYTGGLVGEVSYGSYGTDVNDGYSHTFKNITIDSSVKVSGLWGSFGCGMGGVIGGKWGDATVKMENVVSAPVMDVYNDVVSAYQWYAFRGCGMLIGHTEEPYSDGRHSGNATANFLECENVKVYYGDWVDQNYYRFSTQTDKDGNPLWYSNYPWVRAEAGEYCDAFSNIRYGIPQIGGVKVTEIAGTTAEKLADEHVVITFDQLYGADRGMYGTATHEGVTVFKKNVKTVYIHNNASWTNLKLDYWYKNGEDTWTNLLESVVLTSVEDGSVIYKIEVPAYVDSFKITSSESAEGKTFELSKLADGEHIDLEGNHIHAFVNQECVCGAVIFEFGANQDIGHFDGSSTGEYTETVGEYTLTLTGMKAVYKSANDALGNSCLKLGTGNVNATFTFTVPENAKEAIIYVAKYKDNKSVITVNGIEYELTKNSSDGKYDEIVIDTTETKTITLITDQNTKRCMVNSIVFVVEKLDHEHSYESVVTDPTCTKDGYITYTCSICDHSYVEADEKKTGHSYKEEITTNATCTENGEKINTCSVCGDSQIEEIDALGHNYVDGICSVCGDELENKDVWQLVTDASILQAGDKIVIVAKDYNLALSTTQNTNNRGQIAVTKNSNTIAFVDGVQIITLEAGKASGTFAFNTGSGYLYAASSSGNQLKTKATLDDNGSWKITIAADGTATIVAQGTNSRNTMQYNQQSSLFACYASASQKEISIYKLVGDSGNEGGETPCEHTNTTETTTTATCTTTGVTTVICDDCGVTVSTTPIEALGHTTENGVCERCDETIGGSNTPVEHTLTLNIYANEGTMGTDVITWTSGDVTVKNEKDKSTTAIRTSDSDHFRVYANSKLTISVEGGAIKEIVITTTGSNYATALATSLNAAGYTTTVSGSTVTVTAANSSSVIASMIAQSRIKKVEVTYTK